MGLAPGLCPCPSAAHSSHGTARAPAPAWWPADASGQQPEALSSSLPAPSSGWLGGQAGIECLWLLL